MSSRDIDDIQSFLERALENVKCSVIMMENPNQKVAIYPPIRVSREAPVDCEAPVELNIMEIVLSAKSELFDVETGVVHHICTAITNYVLDLDVQPSYFIVGLHNYTIEILPDLMRFEPRPIGAVRYALASYTKENS